MSKLSKPGGSFDPDDIDPSKMKNIIGQCLLRTNFAKSTRTARAVKQVAVFIDTDTMDPKSEEYPKEKIKQNVTEVTVNKAEFFMLGGKTRYLACLKKQRFLCSRLEHTKPAKICAVAFGKLYVAFKVYLEQQKFISIAGKKLLGKGFYIPHGVILLMEKSLDDFESSCANSFNTDEVFRNTFQLRDACIKEMKHWCTTLIPLRNKRDPVCIPDSPNRYEPFDLMFIMQMQAADENVEAMKYLSLTSSNHQKLSILRSQILCTRHGLSTKTTLPLPDVPITCRHPNFNVLNDLKSQRYTNHHNEIKDLFLRLDCAGDIIPQNEHFKFLYWFDALRELSAVTLGSIAKKIEALRDDENNSDPENWKRHLFALSVYSRICCLLMNMQAATALYVDKTHGLIGKALNAELFTTLQNAVYYVDETFNKRKVGRLMNQLQMEILQETFNFLFTHEGYITEKLTEPPNLNDYQVDFRYELATLYKKDFSPILMEHSDAMFRQLSIEKFEILRLAGELKCVQHLFSVPDYDTMKLTINRCRPHVNSFSGNFLDFLSEKEVEKLTEDAKISFMRSSDREVFAYDLANMILEVAGNTTLGCRKTAMLFFENRFRFYVGTRIPKMLNTREISKFFFTFMWSAIKLERPDKEQAEEVKENTVSTEDEEEGDDEQETEGEAEDEADSDEERVVPVIKSGLDLDDLDDDNQTLIEKCALLIAERFLSHALDCKLYSHEATKTPMGSLIYRWLLNKHFESTRENVVRYHPQKEDQFGPKGILYFGNNETEPLSAAEQAEFMPMSVKLSNELLTSEEIDEILGLGDREMDLSVMIYVEASEY